MSSDSKTPALPQAINVTGKVLPVNGQTLVTYHLSFGPNIGDEALEAVFRTLRDLSKSEDRIKAFSFSPDGDVIVAAFDWEPYDEPFRVYTTLHRLFQPRLPYCGVITGGKSLTDELCKLQFAVAGLDPDKYEHFQQGMQQLPHVVSSKRDEDTLSFHVVARGSLSSETGRKMVASSLESCGLMLRIPPLIHVEVLGVVFG